MGSPTTRRAPRILLPAAVLYLPTKRGARFSAKAARPSFASSLANRSPNSSASRSSAPGREVEQPLRDAQRDRALGRELPGDLERVVEDGIRDRVDEADPQCLLRVDLAAGEDQLLRDAEAADAGEPLRAAPPGDDAEVDLGLAEPRVARGVAQVAAERELAAAAEREAVDRRDRRLRHLLEQSRRLVAERSPRLRL